MSDNIKKIYELKGNFSNSTLIKTIDVSSVNFIKQHLTPTGGWMGSVKSDEKFWGDIFFKKEISILKEKEKDDFLTSIIALHFNKFPESIKTIKQKEKIARIIAANRGFSFLYVVHCVLEYGLVDNLTVFQILKYNNHHTPAFNAFQF